MPILNGPIACFVRKHRLVRRTAFVGGLLVGLYFLGAWQGWWDRFLFQTLISNVNKKREAHASGPSPFNTRFLREH